MTEQFQNVSSYDKNNTKCAINVKHNLSLVSGAEIGQNVLMTLGARIKQQRISAGMSQGELARALGYKDGDGQSTISSWERDRTEPSRDIVQKIADVLGVELGVIEGPGSEPAATVPAKAGPSDRIFINQLDIRFGMGGGAVYDSPVEAKPMAFSREWIRQITSAPADKLFWASGFGDSMYPTIGDRDIVLVDCSQVEPRIRDQIWALNQYGQGMIKRLKATAEGYMIVSDNPTIPPELAADGSMEVVGRVIAVVRRL